MQVKTVLLAILPVIIVKHNVWFFRTLECPLSDCLSSIGGELPLLQLVTEEDFVPGLDHLIHVLLADPGLHHRAQQPGL